MKDRFLISVVWLESFVFRMESGACGPSIEGDDCATWEWCFGFCSIPSQGDFPSEPGADYGYGLYDIGGEGFRGDFL